MHHSASEYTQRVWKPSFALRPIIPCDNQRLTDGADIAIGDLRRPIEDNIASVYNPICYYTNRCAQYTKKSVQFYDRPRISQGKEIRATTLITLVDMNIRNQHTDDLHTGQDEPSHY